MSTKTNTSEKITATSKKTGKQTLKTHDAGPKHVTKSPTEEVILIGKGDFVEVTVKRGEKIGQKHTSPAISSPKQRTERKKSATSNSEPLRSWGAIFRGELLKSQQSPKDSKSKEINKNSNTNRIDQNRYNKHTGTVASKKIPVQNKLREGEKYILVQDRAVQCPEIYNNANRHAESNPVRTLNSLMNELKDLVTKKDDRTCKIFTEMEDVLFRISESPAKPVSIDLKKLEIKTLELKESNNRVKAMCESWALEREELESLIRKRDAQIKEANKKQEEIEFDAAVLTEKLDEVTRVTKVKDETISVLERKIRNYEKIISDLKAELTNQTELSRLNEYLIMEKNKISELCSHKDTLITQYKNSVRDLEIEIEKLKLKNIKLNEVFEEKEGTSSQSAILTGRAFSSPTSSFSDHSNKFIHDFLDISAVHACSTEHDALKEDIPVRDLAPPEFVSLLEESSPTILDQSQVMNDKGIVIHNKSNIVPYRNDVTPKRCLHHSSEKGHNKENDACKVRKFSRFKERQKDNTENSSFCHNTSKHHESVASSKQTVSDIKKQEYNMHINRIPINVPSPLRNYPHPDWSESSLPSVSTASDLDTVPPNDI